MDETMDLGLFDSDDEGFVFDEDAARGALGGDTTDMDDEDFVFSDAYEGGDSEDSSDGDAGFLMDDSEDGEEDDFEFSDDAEDDFDFEGMFADEAVEEEEEVDEQLQQQLQEELGEAVCYAVGTVLDFVPMGAFWFFDTAEKGNLLREAFDGANDGISIRSVGEDALIELNPNFVFATVQRIEEGAIPDEDKEAIMRCVAQNRADFERWLYLRGVEGFSGQVGIYGFGDEMVEGTDGGYYSSFAITMSEALAALSKWGYVVMLDGEAVLPKDAARRGIALYKSLQLAADDAAALITVKSTFSKEKLNALLQAERAKAESSSAT